MSGNIKKSIVILSLALVVVAFSRIAMAVTSGPSPLNLTATARVVKAFTITQQDANSVDFGTIVSNPAGGTVTAAGTTTSASGVTIIKHGHAGSCEILGEPNLVVTVAVSGTITLAGAGAPMDVSLGLDDSRSPELNDVSLDASGNASVPIYGQLTVNAAQVAGTYTGTYTVTVTYNDLP